MKWKLYKYKAKITKKEKYIPLNLSLMRFRRFYRGAMFWVKLSEGLLKLWQIVSREHEANNYRVDVAV